MVNPEFWKDKRVVLLGGAGPIGIHLAKALIPVAKDVKVVDDFSAGKLSNIPDGARVVKADLRYPENAEDAVMGKDIVFHLASQHGGRGYVSGHKVELYDNLSLDATIFRACADVGVEKVIFSSSACAYPIDLQTNSDDWVFLSEDMIDYENLRQADGPYGTEKLLGELMLDAYVERGNFKGCSTRSFTVYGPYMGETHAICALIAKTMIRQNPFEIWGDGKQIRSWTYVEDNVEGAILAAEHIDRGAINIGIEDRLTPLSACQDIWLCMGWKPTEIKFLKEKPVGPRNRVANSSKLKSLGWKPKYSFYEGLEKTIEWYESTHNVNELQRSLDRKMTER